MKTVLFSSLFTGSPTYNLPHAGNADSHLSVGSGAAFLRASPLPSFRVGGELNGQNLGMKFSSTNFKNHDMFVNPMHNSSTYHIVALFY